VALHDARGQLLTSFVDVALKKGETSPFPVNTLDPIGTWKATADGDVFVVVRDLYGTTRWGVERTYRLNIEPRREEACVAILPPAGGIAVRPGGSVTVPVHALRRGGHEAAIRIRADKLPPGLEANELVIPAKQASASWKISATKDARAWVGTLSLAAETELDAKRTTVSLLGLAPVRAGVVRRTDGVVAAIIGAGK
jgi:hypothetical protein